MKILNRQPGVTPKPGPMGPPQVGGGVGLAGGRPMPAGGRPMPAGGAPIGPPQVGGGVGVAGGRPMPAGGRPMPAGGAPMGPVRMAKGGSASSRADGCAMKGKTKGTMIKMKSGGYC